MKKQILFLVALLSLATENKAQNFQQSKKIIFSPSNEITTNSRTVGVNLSLKNGIFTAGSSGSLMRPWSSGDPIYMPSKIYNIPSGTDYTAQRLTDVTFNDPANFTTEFGTSSATNGTVAVFGEPNYFEGVSPVEAMGSATVFELNAGTWQPKQRLLATDKANRTLFGTSVAVNDDQIIIGTKVDYPAVGKIYVFEKDINGTWLQAQRIDAPNAVDVSFKNFFGTNLTVCGDFLVTALSLNSPAGYSFAFIYKKNALGIWELQQEIKVPVSFSSFFTNSLAINENYLAIGGDDGTFNGECVLMFEKDGSGLWSFKQKLSDPDLVRATFFAVRPTSLSLSGNLLAVGAPSNSTNELDQDLLAGTGAVFIYNRGIDGIWAKKQKLVAMDRFSSNFGNSVALDGNTLVTSSALNFRNEKGIYQASTYYEGEIYIFKNLAAVPLPSQASTSFSPGRVSSALFSTEALEPILTIGINGANPLRSNLTTAKVWTDTDESADLNGKVYLTRHYEITPTNNALTSTGTVTLYFNQQDFLDFNSNPAKTADFPTSPTDLNGIANLRILKISGSSADGTGAFNTYAGAKQTINPDDDKIIWNSAESRWEVSFTVTGFSGFFATSEPTVLPLQLVSFSGEEENFSNFLTWKTSSENNTLKFVVEKSETANLQFSTIAEVPANGIGSNTYVYTDRALTLDVEWLYYRLKMVDKDGTYSYSPVISVKNKGLATPESSVFPNPTPREFTLSLSSSTLIGSGALIVNTNGSIVSRVKIYSLNQKIDLTNYSAGVYFIVLKNGETIKIVKQ